MMEAERAMRFQLMLMLFSCIRNFFTLLIISGVCFVFISCSNCVLPKKFETLETKPYHADSESQRFSISNIRLNYIEDITQETLKINQINLIDKNIGTYRFVLPSKIIDTLQSGRFVLSVSKKYFSMFCRNSSPGDDLFILLDKTTLQNKIYRVSNTYGFRNCALLGDSLALLSSFYDYRTAYIPFHSILAHLDLESGGIVHYETPQIDNIPFSIRVNNWMDNTAGCIAVAQTVHYRIDFFDTQTLKLKDSITNCPHNKYRFEESDDARNISTGYNYQNLVDADDSLWRIEKVFMPDSITLLVSVRPPGNKSNIRYLDVWKNLGGEWVNTIQAQKHRAIPLFFISKRKISPLSWSTPTDFSGEFMVYQGVHLPPPLLIGLGPVYTLRTILRFLKGDGQHQIHIVSVL